MATDGGPDGKQQTHGVRGAGGAGAGRGATQGGVHVPRADGREVSLACPAPVWSVRRTLCGLWAPSCPEGLSHQGITGHLVHGGPGLAPQLSVGGCERGRKVEPEVINLGRLPGKGEFREG